MCFRAEIHSRKEAAKQAEQIEQVTVPKKASASEHVETAATERAGQEAGVMATLRRLFSSSHATQQRSRQHAETVTKTTDLQRAPEKVD